MWLPMGRDFGLVTDDRAPTYGKDARHPLSEKSQNGGLPWSLTGGREGGAPSPVAPDALSGQRGGTQVEYSTVLGIGAIIG